MYLQLLPSGSGQRFQHLLSTKCICEHMLGQLGPSLLPGTERSLDIHELLSSQNTTSGALLRFLFPRALASWDPAHSSWIGSASPQAHSMGPLWNSPQVSGSGQKEVKNAFTLSGVLKSLSASGTGVWACVLPPLLTMTLRPRPTHLLLLLRTKNLQRSKPCTICCGQWV